MRASRRGLARPLAIGLTSLVATALLAAGAVQGATASTTSVLSGDVAHLASARVLGPAAGSTRLDIDVVMQGQDPAGLANLLAEQAAGRAAALTPSEFNARFGVSVDRANAVRHWLGSAGVAVPADQPLQSRTVFAVGTVSSVGSLLHVSFDRYRGSDGTDFIANLNPPTVPAGLGIVTVSGLNTSIRLRPLLTQASAPTPPDGAPISQATSARDLWKLYNQPSANTGQGQQLATLLFGSKAEYDPTVPNDLRAYENSFTPPLPHVPLRFVWQDKYVDPGAASDTLGSGLAESDLDVQAATGMAPGASAITLYEAQDGVLTDIANALGKWVNDPHGALQLSASLGACETLLMFGYGDVLDPLLQQATAEGRTVFAATGDTGAGCPPEVDTNGANSPLIDAEYPASSPFVVAVGGTVVTEGSHKTSFSEYSWSGSGGGMSKYEAAPTWQTSAGPPALAPCATNTAIWNWQNGVPPFSAPPNPAPASHCRALPDVSAQSGDLVSGYDIIVSGSATTEAGTSLSAPLWQGMWARIQAAAPAGDSRGLGFASPVLYRTGANASKYGRDFFDITVGDNGPYPATPGWDFVSGWGSPNVTNLMTDLDGGVTPSCGSGCPVVGAARVPGVSASAGKVCPPGRNQISGKPGHATSIAGEADTSSVAGSSLSQADLDIISANLSWNQAAKTLTGRITVQNLNALPPDGLPTNEYYRYYFTIDGSAYYLVAERTPTGTTFLVANSSLPAGTKKVSGTFDPAHNTITIVMPASALASPAVGGPSLASGDTLTGMAVWGQRYVGVLTLTADSESATCAYRLG